MSMRIDGQSQPHDAEAARRLETTQIEQRQAARGPAPGAAKGDRVEVSSDAQLVAAAIRAAEDEPAVRPDAVERGRRALEDGTLGQDAARLADRLIDAMLGE